MKILIAALLFLSATAFAASFLVDREGRVIRRFEPAVEPQSTELVSAVESSLKK